MEYVDKVKRNKAKYTPEVEKRLDVVIKKLLLCFVIKSKGKKIVFKI